MDLEKRYSASQVLPPVETPSDTEPRGGRLHHFTLYTTVSIRGLAAPKLRITREVWAGLPWVILWHP